MLLQENSELLKLTQRLLILFVPLETCKAEAVQQPLGLTDGVVFVEVKSGKEGDAQIARA